MPRAFTFKAMAVCSLCTRRPALSIVYTLTFARFAVATTDSNLACTAGGIASPSAKNTTVFRPGNIDSESIRASRPLVVAYPCWSRIIDS